MPDQMTQSEVGKTSVRALRVHGANDLRLDRVAAPVARDDQAIVRVRYGGICGSDVHYWQDGAVGMSVLRAPMILGHEIVGTVAVAAADGAGPPVGQAVAVHPAESCGICRWCQAGKTNLCADTRYLGSAGQWPHTDGGFVDQIAVAAARLLPVPDGLDLRRAGLAEPAAVAWHAVNRAEAVGGRIAGADVLVVGGGPIGLLVMAADRHRGAARTTVIDVHERPLETARQVGASRTLTAAALAAGDVELAADVAFESSGSVAGLGTALRQTRRGGTVVVVGQLPKGELPVPAGLVVSSEMTVTGSLRIGSELSDALAFLVAAGADLDPLVTDVVPVGNALEAFDLASDPGRSTKVLLDFSPVDESTEESRPSADRGR